MVFYNGKFLKEEELQVSAFGDAFMYGYGVYETLRTYQGKIFRLAEHVERLFVSAHLIGMIIKHPAEKIIQFTNQALEKSGLTEARIKIVLTEKDLIIWPQKLMLRPPEWYQTGIKIVTLKIERIMPEAKSNNALSFVLGQKQAQKHQVYETLLIDEEGFAREGSISNLFWIKDQVLYTTQNRILKGITRNVILDQAKELMEVKEKDELLSNIFKADEVFITNTTSEILPVVQIDALVIGKGEVGGGTRGLMGRVQYGV
jgi:branched-chain amino acid aminotransferase